jgi:hypothetical protein
MARRLLRGFGIILIAFPEPFTTALGVAFLFASYAQFGKQKADSDERLQELLENWGEYYRPIGYMMLTRQTTPVGLPRTANRSLSYRRMAAVEALKLPANLHSYGERVSERRRSLPGIRVITPRWEVARMCAGNVVPERWPWGGEQRGRKQTWRLCVGEESLRAGIGRCGGEGSESLSVAPLMRAKRGLPGLLERRHCAAMAVC